MKINKRKAVLFLCGVLFMLVLAACGGGTDNQEETNAQQNDAEEETTETTEESKQELVVVSWGGDYQAAQKKAMFTPFAEEAGVQVTEDSPVNIGKLKAMVTGDNVQWDVVDVLGADVPKLVSQDLIEPINYDVVQKENLLESAVQSHSVAIDYYSTVLSYNKEAISGEAMPESWEDFFDMEQFPGGRALYKSPTTTLEIALLADGVQPENLYPLDVDRAFEKLNEIKSKIIWWEEGAQPPQLLADNEVTFAAAWNGRIASAVDNGQPLDFIYNQGILDSEAWVVPKGAPNKETAMQFIDFASRAEPQAGLLKEIPYGPTNTNAFDHMESDYAESLPTHESNYDQQIVLDVQWWHENYEEVNDRFQAWLLQ